MKNKPFLTHDKLIEKLVENKIEFDDNVINILESEGYYSIITGYKDLFLHERKPKEIYFPGTHLNEIYSLFDFDRELRFLFLRKLIKAETTFKTMMAYAFCDTYGDEAYTEIASFKKLDNTDKVTEFAKLQDRIKKITENEKNKSIAHYLKDHKRVPFWLLVNYLDFGSSMYFYKYLDDNLQNLIAKNIGLRQLRLYNKKIFIDKYEIAKNISAFSRFRNLCAHDERFYCTNHGGYSIYTLFLKLKNLLSPNEYALLESGIKTIHDHYQDSFITISIDDVFNEMGFPKDWK